MVFLAVLLLGGLVAGLLLLRTAPLVGAGSAGVQCALRVSVIVPARNEAANLPLLLESLRRSSRGPMETLVVDDGSTDGTAEVARECGARVIASEGLPEGWTGKTWACHQGAMAAAGEAFCFLDADTRFVEDGFARLVARFAAMPVESAVSVLPYHRTVRWYEELSLYFNVLVAMGAGGFGGLDAPHLFGQSLLIRREMYLKAGGHARVKGEILENLFLAGHVRDAGGRAVALAGRGAVEMRMFPEGLAQLRESWEKAFVAGAGVTSPVVLGLSVYWLAAAMAAAILVAVGRGGWWWVWVGLYLLSAAQIFWYGRQVGTFRWVTAILYPVPLVFYFATFARAAWRRRRGGRVMWRGREV